jgi:hypothetical protein
MALALAAQTPADLALVDRRLAGRRDGETFAQELYATWGARSLLVDAGLVDAANDENTDTTAERPDWLADCDVAARVRAALLQAGLDQSAA